MLVPKLKVTADVGFGPKRAKGSVMVVAVPGGTEQLKPGALPSEMFTVLAALVVAAMVQPTALLMVTPRLPMTLALNTAGVLHTSIIASPPPRAAAVVYWMAKVVGVAPWTRVLGVAEVHTSAVGAVMVV